MTQRSAQRPSGRRRERLHEIIFEADTPAGKRFDSLLLVLSVAVVMLESVASVRAAASPCCGDSSGESRCSSPWSTRCGS